MFKIEIETGNAAFHDEYGDIGMDDYAKRYEIKRLLTKIAEELPESGRTEGSFIDYNGNKVGTWKLD